MPSISPCKNLLSSVKNRSDHLTRAVEFPKIPAALIFPGHVNNVRTGIGVATAPIWREPWPIGGCFKVRMHDTPVAAAASNAVDP